MRKLFVFMCFLISTAGSVTAQEGKQGRATNASTSSATATTASQSNAAHQAVSAPPPASSAAYPMAVTEHRLSDLENSWSHLEQMMSAVAVAVAAMAIMLAVAAVLGYKLIEYSAEKQMERATAELSGRIYGVQGLLFGRLCRDDDDKVKREQFLELAIEYTAKAREKLEESPKKSPYWWFVVNNLAFYYALRGSHNPLDDTYGEEALEWADLLKRNVHKLPLSEVQDTYARVIAAFCQCDPDTASARLIEAHRWLKTVIDGRRDSDFTKEKAKRTLASVEAKWRDMFGAGFPSPSSSTATGKPLNNGRFPNP
jgi:hypothetical protein